MKVKRSDGSTREIIDKEQQQLEALFNSWDYWESRGLPHPMKRARKQIRSMQEKQGHDAK